MSFWYFVTGVVATVISETGAAEGGIHALAAQIGRAGPGHTARKGKTEIGV